MVTTRSKTNAESHDGTAQDAPEAPSQQQRPSPRASTNTSRKRKSSPTNRTSTPPTAPPTKKQRQRQDSLASETTTPPHHHPSRSRLPVPTTTPPVSPLLAAKARALIAAHGTAHPFHAPTPLDDPDAPTNETILAHLAHAILRSTRMAPATAARGVELLVAANGTCAPALGDSPWALRERILAKACGGNRARYRDVAAGRLGLLAAFVEERWGGDASAMLPEEEEGGDGYGDGDGFGGGGGGGGAERWYEGAVRERLAEIEGVEPKGADVFVAFVQGVWQRLAPYLEPRNVQTAREVGLAGGDVWALFECVGRRGWDMALLNAALTKVREDGEVDVWRKRFSEGVEWMPRDGAVGGEEPPVTTDGYDEDAFCVPE
ncbi:hypothetical protein SLS58_009709 [Diplodia intermedia]|uniref:Uncharacterized protein n=1 Tax=Diplodia intermedia TaxID=856260 RepID=A0ABR3TAR7_9PEZI